LHDLRTRAREAEALTWPPGDVRPYGALDANLAYHARQRRLGAEEMRALLTALGMTPPLSPADVREVLLTAIALYLHTDGITADTSIEDDRIVVNISRCPIYDRFADEEWHGLTACGCFSRRFGWYDVLGLPADEELLMNRKWDDPICRTAIHLPLPVL
jgi:hypothetical protein